MNSRVAFGAFARGEQVVVVIDDLSVRENASLALSVEQAEALARYIAVAIDIARVNRAKGEAA